MKTKESTEESTKESTEVFTEKALTSYQNIMTFESNSRAISRHSELRNGELAV